MKCLSVKQPWAYLLAVGIKDVENRSWATSHRGWIAIHASKSFDHSAMADFRAAMAEAGQVIPPLAEVRGAIIAVVRVVDCTTWRPGASEWHEKGYVGWYVEDARILPDPIFVNGTLGLWDCDKLIAPGGGATVGGLGRRPGR